MVSGPLSPGGNEKLIAGNVTENLALAHSMEAKDPFADKQATEDDDTPMIEVIDPIMTMPNQSNY